MSVKVMGEVWELELKPNHLVVLLALADHADHDGGGVFPSQALVAWKTGYGERQVRRIVAELEAEGLLVLVEDRRAQNLPNVYRIDTAAGKKKAPRPRPQPGGRPLKPPVKMSAGSESETTGQAEQNPRTFAAKPPVTAMSDEPSGEPSSNRQDSSLPNGSGRAPAVENSEEKPLTEGMVMGLWRRLHYAPDGKPPAGYSDGRDMSIIRQLVKKGYRLERIADAAEGLALARRNGELQGEEGGKTTLRFMMNTERYGRPLLQWCEDYYLASPNRKAQKGGSALARVEVKIGGAS
ncbi:MAG TPA: helix-turn-helix domain-containing protein [Longimicrobiaceae bacterium]|nr:helix-turn-helix domain-containing protein [Longimicrobiaceae bacterium]